MSHPGIALGVNDPLRLNAANCRGCDWYNLPSHRPISSK